MSVLFQRVLGVPCVNFHGQAVGWPGAPGGQDRIGSDQVAVSYPILHGIQSDWHLDSMRGYQ